MIAAPTPVAGPHRPRPETPELVTGQIRRTTSIDILRPDGLTGPIEADIRGRDLVRHTDGHHETTDHLKLRVRIDAWTGRVEAIDDQSSGNRTSKLVGASVRRRFAVAVADALPEDAAGRTLLYSALEDLNGANLVSGYAPLRAGLLGASQDEGEARAAMQVDVCAGWARGGAMVERLRLTGDTAVPMGPPAPNITDPAGPIASSPAGQWHEVAPLAEHTVRRLRCLDVHRPDPGNPRGGVTAHFRDSYQGAQGEMVLHEYLVSAGLIPAGAAGVLHIEGIVVDSRVLPWNTCPAAAPSAARLNGTAVADLPGRVRAELVGPTTCTHLNSTVRSLADAAPLIAVLARPGRA